MEEFEKYIPEWAFDLECAITVCDSEFRIIFMNKRSRDTFADGTDRLIGANILECHPEHARATIHRLIAEQCTNAYTIEKNGVHKLIFQTPWRHADGTLGGLVELSMVIPAQMPHYIRKPKA